jgi:hypothetical protein
MTLLSEIQAKCTPEMIAAKEHGAIAELVSVDRTKVQAPFMVSERGIMDKYPGGPLAADAVLAKLEAFAASAVPGSGPVKRALKFLGTADGLDIGAATTRAQLDVLATAGVITTTEATNLKSLAVVPAPVSVTEVIEALQGA